MGLVPQLQPAQLVSRRRPNSLRDNTTAGFRYHAAYLAGALFHALFSFFNEDSNLDGILDVLSHCVWMLEWNFIMWGGSILCFS